MSKVCKRCDMIVPNDHTHKDPIIRQQQVHAMRLKRTGNDVVSLIKLRQDEIGLPLCNELLKRIHRWDFEYNKI